MRKIHQDTNIFKKAVKENKLFGIKEIVFNLPKGTKIDNEKELKQIAKTLGVKFKVKYFKMDGKKENGKSKGEETYGRWGNNSTSRESSKVYY